MKTIDRLIVLWSISLFLLVVSLPIFADIFLRLFALPFILSNMLVALFIGLFLGQIQARLLKPFINSPHWASNTTFAAVSGAFVVGAMRIYAQAATDLSGTVTIPIVYLVMMVGVVQAMTLPKTVTLRLLWVLPYALLSVFIASQFFAGAIFAALTSIIPLMFVVRRSQKRKNESYRHALSRLSATQSHHDHEQQYAAKLPCSLNQKLLS